MLGAERPGEAGFLLMSLQLGHGGEQGPDLAVLNPDVAVAARSFGLEGDPALQQPLVFRGIFALGDREIGGFDGAKLALQHRPDMVATLQRLDVPGEGDDIAPVAIVL